MIAPVLSYHVDAYRRELDVEIVDVIEESGRFHVRLDDTLLFPEGGGQPHDHGTLEVGSKDGERASVVAGELRDGAIWHLLAEGSTRPTPGPARLALAWPRRYDHMQQHTAQHLMTAVASRELGWETTAFHLGVERCDIEVDAACVDDASLLQLEELVMALVREARPVVSRWVSLSEYEELDVRSRGLPDGFRGDVRLIEIQGVDLNTCGGTHVASLAEIEALKILGAESLRGGTRIYWLAGGRVRSRFDAQMEILRDLRSVLEGADDELAGLARLRVEEVRALSSELRRERTARAQALAEALTREPDDVVVRDLGELGEGMLPMVAKQLRGQVRGKVLLTSRSGGRTSLVLLAPGLDDASLRALGGRVVDLLGGRGGGAKGVFQGVVESVDDLSSCLELLRGHSP